jgi:hypothetical protein
LSEAQPTKLGKPYPLGQCLEISQAMEREFRLVRPNTLSPDAARAYAALNAFMQHGGTVRQVWGELRGRYFQNAFLVGTLYIDASNDTVVRMKPPVEILPLEESQLVPVKDFEHFRRVGAAYWEASMFPNHALPSLAPYFPLVAVIPGGGAQLHSDINYMLSLNLRGEFRPAEAVLNEAPLPAELFRLMAQCLTNSSFELAGNSEDGRNLALRLCSEYREQGRQHSEEKKIEAARAARDVNRLLSRITIEKVR